MLGDDWKLKTIFLVLGIFPGKADSVTLLGFEYAINPQNLIKIVRAIFEKFEILNFFLIWTTLNFKGMGKTKKNGSRYLHEDPIYRIWTRWVNWFRLYVRRRSHRQTDRHTHTHTHTNIHTLFLKHIFRLWEWCRRNNHQKIEVENFDDCKCRSKVKITEVRENAEKILHVQNRSDR